MAGIDDFLARADALPEPRAKTREDRIQEFKQAVAYAEKMAKTQPHTPAYRIALLSVRMTREELELDAEDEAWADFLAEHPELSAEIEGGREDGC